MNIRTFVLPVLATTLIGCGEDKKTANATAQQAKGRPSATVVKEAITEITVTAEFDQRLHRRRRPNPNGGVIEIYNTYKHDPKVVAKYGEEVLPCDIEFPDFSFEDRWSVSEDKKTLSFDENAHLPLYKLMRVGEVVDHYQLLLGEWVNASGDGTQSILEENYVTFTAEGDDEYSVYKLTWTKTCSKKFDARDEGDQQAKR